MTFAELARRLRDRAAALAVAQAETRLRAARKDGGSWRHPHLLWPLFVREDG